MTFRIENDNVVVVEADDAEQALEALVGVVADIDKNIIQHPGYKSADGWFSFELEVGGQRLDEEAFFPGLPASTRALVQRFVEQLTRYNTDHGPVYAHEELETGTSAVEHLVTNDLELLPLYIAFLESLDLDHTVEQLDVVDRLVEVHGEEALAPLMTFLREHGGELFADWFHSREVVPRPPLHQATHHGRVDEVKRLISEGADLEERDHEGYAPLHLAYSSFEAAKLLLDAGAEIDSQDGNGRTFLQHMCSLDQGLAYVRLLLDAGADIHIRDNEGRSAIHHALQVPALKMLLEHGAQLDDRDAKGQTLLHILAPWVTTDVIETALERGADPNAIDHKGKSPLHIAVLCTELANVRALVAGGADLGLKDASGKSPRALHPWMFPAN